MTYCHTQRGILIHGLFLPLALLFLCVWIFTRLPSGAIVGLVIVEIALVLIMFLFYSLTVSIDEKSVSLRLGIGLIKARFELAEITSAKPVRNHWYDGWGVRILSNGYMYNVSGLGAVEIALNTGAIHRIGTDEPDILAQAINTARHASA
jgi:hypothetical protein